MYAIKCDMCKKEIKDTERGLGEYVHIGHRPSFSDMALCKKCGEPVIAFLKKKKLVSNPS